MIEIIVNSRSKKSLNELKKIKRVLNEKKLPYRVLKTSKNTNAKDLMNKIHGDELIVIGGDGTINEVINNYHGKEIIYLAYGSGNDLARSIKFKKDIEISRLLESKRFIEYDVGVVNDKKFCSGFDIGFNANIIKRANGSKLKKYIGKYIYLLQGVIGILMLKKYKAKISWDDGEIKTSKLYLLNAMIQPYEGGGIKFANGASEIFKPIMENTLNYLNVKKSNDDNTIQSYQMENLVGENVESTIVNLQQKTKNIITIGSGTNVIGQYPSAGNIIKQGERVFLLVSDENIITPNFTGWSKVDVLNYAKLSGLDIETEGNGFAKQQSIPAQRFVKKGEKIKIKFG